MEKERIVTKRKKVDISIIIPLYKGQKYCDCLLNMIENNCLYENLYQKCSVEVVFVNDYPDERIIIEWENRFFDVYIMEHDKNQGIHSSRVYGILFAKGEYVIMLDQDDLVRNNWLHSQWHKIVSENVDCCVCNGWSRRFRILAKDEDLKNRVNDLEYYLAKGCAICSPGQVIIKRASIPFEWMENIQVVNGADDFFLWITMLKKGKTFCVNNSHLYYHSPERNLDSINLTGIVRSLKETVKILKSMSLLDEDEIDLLNRQINRKKDLGEGRLSRPINEMDQYDIIQFNESIKFQNLFHIIYDWMKIRNNGIKISDFLKKNGYYDIAIYGLGYIGESLFDELYKSEITVKYGIDYTALDFRNELLIYRIEDELENVDAVIFTILEKDRDIVDTIKSKVDCPVIFFCDILMALGEK